MTLATQKNVLRNLEQSITDLEQLKTLMDYFTFILKHLKLETTEKQESRKCYLRSRKVNIEVCRTQKCRYLVCLKGTNTHPKKILFLTLAIAMTKNMLNRLGHEIRHF